MLKTKLLLFATIAVIYVGSASAQLKNFTWDEGLCTYRGLYDSKKYSETELRNTTKLFSPDEFNLIGQSAAVFSISDLDRIDVDGFDKAYREMRAKLESLRIVKVPYFQELKQAKLAEMEQIWQLNRTTMLAHSNPSVLSDYTAAPSCNVRFAGPLAKGGDDLMRVWLEVNMDSRSKNSDPERLRREFERQKASPDKFKYARIEVLTFGWYNCANDKREHVPFDTIASERFQKLLSRVRGQCDEP